MTNYYDPGEIFSEEQEQIMAEELARERRQQEEEDFLDLPKVDDNDDFDAEPDYDDEKEEMIEREGISADNNGWY